jgi:XTP/dITP diphosphohydrolase
VPAPRVVLATSNPGKLAELQDAFPAWRFSGLDEHAGAAMPEETGATFEENASAKARAVCAATGLPALADDSGLCVDALDGAPGVRSARFAGEGAGDAANRAALLARMRHVDATARSARFVCVLALARPDGRVELARGECPGRLIAEERGTGGFGYDPLFVPDGETRTFAEMSIAEKATLSHRGRAITLARARFALP